MAQQRPSNPPGRSRQRLDIRPGRERAGACDVPAADILTIDVAGDVIAGRVGRAPANYLDYEEGVGRDVEVSRVSIRVCRAAIGDEGDFAILCRIEDEQSAVRSGKGRGGFGRHRAVVAYGVGHADLNLCVCDRVQFDPGDEVKTVVTTPVEAEGLAS